MGVAADEEVVLTADRKVSRCLAFQRVPLVQIKCPCKRNLMSRVCGKILKPKAFSKFGCGNSCTKV